METNSSNSLRRDIAEHDLKVRKIREEFPLGNLLNQYEFANMQVETKRKQDLVYAMFEELTNLGVGKTIDGKPHVLSPTTLKWVKVHDPIWGIVAYSQQLLNQEVTRVFTLERAARLLQGKKITLTFNDDI